MSKHFSVVNNVKKKLTLCGEVHSGQTDLTQRKIGLHSLTNAGGK